MEHGKIYRYIIKKNNGYAIEKNKEHYGWYNDLTDALFDRDRLEQVDWDWALFVLLPEVPNHYKAIELPPFKKKRDYITCIPTKWRVQKKINGRMRYFGTYDTLEEAEEKRNELLSEGIL